MEALVYGDPFDGLHVEGPYPDGYLTEHEVSRSDTWWIVDLDEPTEMLEPWHEKLNLIQQMVEAMSPDDRDDAIEALRSRFDEIYDRPKRDELAERIDKLRREIGDR